MVDLFSWVEETKALSEKVKQFSTIIELMVQQVKECALFIREYAQQGFICMYPIFTTWSFLVLLRSDHSSSDRTFTSTISSSFDETIEVFKSQFAHLNDQFQKGVTVSTFGLLTRTDAMVRSGLDELRQDLKAHTEQASKQVRCLCAPSFII
jgi:hypothetical protein